MKLLKLYSRCVKILILICLTPIIVFAQVNKPIEKPADTMKYQLGEVAVTARTAVKISGDTVSYVTDSFTHNKNANVEDALKRLPGIEVDMNGKITANGKPITKIFINGQEYKASDFRVLIQSMPAEILDKIHVADWHSEDDRFSGLKHTSDEKMLDFKVKKKYEQSLISKLQSGYGTKDRYQDGLFANYMETHFRLTVTGGLNNIGGSSVGSTSGQYLV